MPRAIKGSLTMDRMSWRTTVDMAGCNKGEKKGRKQGGGGGLGDSERTKPKKKRYAFPMDLLLYPEFFCWNLPALVGGGMPVPTNGGTPQWNIPSRAVSADGRALPDPRCGQLSAGPMGAGGGGGGGVSACLRTLSLSHPPPAFSTPSFNTGVRGEGRRGWDGMGWDGMGCPGCRTLGPSCP